MRISQMADYWKSQARKYCDFCKCWISDNKPSIQFHEGGKKHKVNVAAKLKDISKKSQADQKARQRFAEEMNKIEEAATKAYMRDAEQNLDYSAKVMKGINDNKPLTTTYIPPPVTTNWHAAKADSKGDVYYWNSVTGESKWEKPAEGFHALSDKSKKGKPPKHKKPPKSGKRKGDHKFDKNKRKKKDESKEEFVMPVIEPIITGPAYGRWEKVESSSFTAPASEPAPKFEEPKLEFKEKSLPESTTSSESSSSTTIQFKKSKFRGNVRQRNDLL